MATSTSVGSSNLTILNSWTMVDAVNTSGTSNVTTVYSSGSSNASGTVTISSPPSTITGTMYVNGRGGTATNSVAGNFGELLVFSNALTTTQRQSIEGYLAWKWGLQVQVPAPVSTPLSVPGCALWLDGADPAGTGVKPSVGATVSSWVDKSGSGNTVTCPSSTYSSNSTTGQTGIFFNNSATSALTLSPYCSFFVSSYNTGPNFPTSYPGLLGSYYVVLFGNYWLGSNGYGAGGAWAPSRSVNTYGSYLSDSRNIAVNSVAAVPPAAISVRVGAGDSYPGGNQWIGHIYEVIVYNQTLTTSQRQSVENYLMGKWGIKPSLPTTHPFYSLPAFSRPFGPTDIPGCALWLDGADPAGTGIAPTNNTSLATWVDKSGNTRNASASSAATYTSNGISFSSGNYYTMNVPYSSNYSIFLVATNTSVAQCYFFGRNSLGGGRFPTFIQGYIGNGIGLEWYEGNDRATISTTPSSPFIASVDHTQGTNITGWYNGSQAFSISQTESYATNAWDTLGQSGYTANYYAGYMKEIIFFGSVLTASQRQQVEGYLAAKWGLLNNLPGKTLSPLNIPGCALWLDAADTSTLTLSTNNVTQWRDKSGSGNNATQATSSSQPTSGGSQNGLNTLLFTGKTMVLPTISLSTQTVFCVYLNTTFTPYGEPVELGPFAFFYAAPSSNVGIGRTGATDEVLANWSTNGLTTSKYTVYGGTVSVSGSTTSVLYFNGNQVASNTVTSSGGQVYYRVGHYAGGTTGYIAEVIVFNSVLSTTQRQSVENYLMSKWGISNVTTHPFKSIPPSTSQPPQFQEVTPGNWKYDWQPYLKSLAAANSSGVTVTTSTITGGATYITNGWAGGVLGPDGNIYFTPSNAANILKLNVTTGVTTNITGGATYTTGGWSGGVLAPNGNIYFCPYNATNILVLNPTTGVTSNLTGGATYTSGGWAGGVVGPDGNIYCCPIGATNILKLNVSTGVTTNITGGATYTATGWVCGQVGPDGNIYFTPVFATNILKLDPSTGVTTNITGGATILSNGYRAGTLGLDGNIYSAPYSSANILKFSVSPPTVTTITGGATMSSAWQGGVLAADGNIYFLPNSASSLIRLNTTTGVTTNITGGATYTNQGWIGGVLAPDGNIYSGPYFSSSILKITFSGLSQLPSLRYCLSPWTNKF